MDGVKVVTGAAAAVLLMACMGPAPVLADTIEAALVRRLVVRPIAHLRELIAVLAGDEPWPAPR